MRGRSRWRPWTSGSSSSARSPGRPPPRPRSCGRRCRRTPRSSGPGPRPGNCGSSGAGSAGRCATRRGRCAPAAGCPSGRRAPGGELGYAVPTGSGELYSYVDHPHPPVPGKTLPLVIALVELPEGVRMVGELLGAGPDQVRIGLPVRAEFVRVDDDLTLPAWRPAGAGGGAARPAPPATPAGEPGPAPGPALPELAVEATPTFVISSALATRDFQDVHHDRDLAIARGSQDLFINILTTTGLVQRFVSGWAGPQAVFKSISIRLGAPCYAGDTLTFSGYVSADEGRERVVPVTGRCRLGDHVTGTVRVGLPGSPS